jgi:hypothetical protein
MCCVVVCDLETSGIGAPYIYDISHLRVKCTAVIRHNFGVEEIEPHKKKLYRSIEHCFNCCGCRIYWPEYDVMTFRSTTDRIYDSGPIRLYYNTTVLQLPTVFSTVTCCTDL